LAGERAGFLGGVLAEWSGAGSSNLVRAIAGVPLGAAVAALAAAVCRGDLR